jgi:pimeloyl-ACP methyl ester carboxylesterase
MSSKVERSATRVRGFDDPEMDFQLIRMLGMAPYGGAALGECLTAARQIDDGNPWSWARAFGELAVRLEAQAWDCFRAGHRVSARELFLRTSNYYRSAEYYANPRLPEHHHFGMKARECFLQAAPLCREVIEVLAIPFEGSALPAYFLRPDADRSPRKTLLVISGFDGTAEESYFQAGAAAVERGFNVLLFEGPGQTGTLRLHPHLTFRPDYEVPVRAVIDYALGRPDVDPDRLAFLGISFGGYFSIRAAANEPRIRALIPNSPIVDLYRYMVAFLGDGAVNAEDDLTPDEVAELADDVVPAAAKWGLFNVCRRFGVPRLGAYFEVLKHFRVGPALQNITCPTLALVGEGEGAESLAQAQEYLEGVSGPKQLYRFTVAEGADTHCQFNNLSLSNHVILDWLDERFA